jgi:hypothetical protein
MLCLASGDHGGGFGNCLPLTDKIRCNILFTGGKIIKSNDDTAPKFLLYVCCIAVNFN